jgi:hypothetical protein
MVTIVGYYSVHFHIQYIRSKGILVCAGDEDESDLSPMTWHVALHDKMVGFFQ